MRACSRSPRRGLRLRKPRRGARRTSIQQRSRARRPRKPSDPRRDDDRAADLPSGAEPYAISELLFYFAFTSLNALSLEGRSYLSGRLGEKLFDESFTLWDEGLDPRLPKAFDLEGVPKQRVLMVEDGVARDVVWDRRTAKQAGDGRLPRDTRSRLRTRRSGRSRSTSQWPAETWPLWTSSPSASPRASTSRLHYLGVVDPGRESSPE